MCGSRIELERERRKERAYGKHLFLGWEDFVVPKEGPAVVAAVESRRVDSIG